MDAARTGPGQPVGRRALSSVAFALLLITPVLVAAIGGGGAGAAVSTSKPTKAAIAKTCEQVADALADGPDPDVDPVGYALAQVRPLRSIKTSDTVLHTDIGNLAAAYETVYKTNDKKGTQAAVNKAGKKIDGICPGAF
jgi:hypothetical protein